MVERALPPAELSNRLVLVVDDDEHTRNLLRDLCESSGFRVNQAEDGNEALTKLAAEKPDLMLLDLMMPQRDGFSVLKAVRENTELAELPVIILTAMGDMDGKIRGMEIELQKHKPPRRANGLGVFSSCGRDNIPSNAALGRG